MEWGKLGEVFVCLCVARGLEGGVFMQENGRVINSQHIVAWVTKKAGGSKYNQRHLCIFVRAWWEDGRVNSSDLGSPF